MKDIRILTWCDLHEDGEQVDAESIEVSIRGRSGTVDLCPEHAAVLMGFRPHIYREADGRKASERQPEAVPCPDCSWVGVSRTSLTKHLRQKHDVGLATLVKNLTCPQCDVSFERVPSLGVHMAKAHDLYACDLYKGRGKKN